MRGAIREWTAKGLTQLVCKRASPNGWRLPCQSPGTFYVEGEYPKTGGANPSAGTPSAGKASTAKALQTAKIDHFEAKIGHFEAKIKHLEAKTNHFELNSTILRLHLAKKGGNCRACPKP